MTQRVLILVLLSLTLYTTSLGQKSKLQGYVYNDQEEPEGRVQLKVLPVRASFTTANNGHFQVFFQTLGPGETVNLVLERANWLVYDPPFGKTTTQALTDRSSPHVYIAEQGSKILLGSRAILALISQYETDRAAALNNVSRLESENRRLHSQNLALSKELDAALERERENKDLNVYLDRYAAFYGVNKDEVLSAVITWAKPAPTDSEEAKAMKLLFNRQYEDAENVAFAGAQKEMSAWVSTGKNKAQLEKYQGDHAGSVIRQMLTAILAPYRERRFRDALAKYAVLQRFLDDNRVPTESFQREMANARLLAASSKASLSRTVTPRRGPEAKRLLVEAIEQFRELLKFDGYERSLWVVAGIQLNLGNALQDLVLRIGVTDGADRLKEAEAAYREAIRIWRLDPVMMSLYEASCRCGQFHLANALQSVGFLGGPDSIQFLKDAEQSYRAGIAAIDRNVQPQEWLAANLNLGRVLQELGRQSGSDTAGYQKQAEAVMRELLAATKSQGHLCGCIELGLAHVLEDQGVDHRGPEAMQFLDDADAHYQAALELTPQREMPEPWAETMMDKAGLDMLLGERNQQKAPIFFRQAIEGWKQVLSLGENEILPQDRLRAQSGLAQALDDLAKTVPEGEQYLKEAETEGRGAVALSKDLSVRPCGCTLVLAHILQALGHLNGPTSINYLKEAEKLLQEALQLDSQSKWEITAELASVHLDLGLAVHPIDQEYIKQSVSGFRQYFENTKTPKSRPIWAGYQATFGRALNIAYGFEDPPNIRLLKESEKAFLAAIEWYRFEEETLSWVMARVDIGMVLLSLAQIDRAASMTYLNKAESFYREIFSHDIRQQYPEYWIIGQGELATALVERAHMPGENHRERLREAETFLREALKFNLLQPNQRNVNPTKFRLANVLNDWAYSEEETESKKIAYLHEVQELRRDLVRTTDPNIDPVDWADSIRKLANISSRLARLDPNPQAQLKEADWCLQQLKKYSLFEHNTEQWLWVQVSLGDLLNDFASDDTRRNRKYLDDAKKVYEDALLVSTRQKLPGAWAALSYGLARTYGRMDNPLEAKRLLLEVLDQYPEDQDALANLASIYHERLFDFAGSFNALTRLLKLQADDLDAQTDFAENNFTTGRFEECAVLINNLLTNKDVYEDDKIALRAIEIGSLIGRDKTDEVVAKLDLLIKEVQRQPSAFEIGWHFDGATYFAPRRRLNTEGG